MSYESHEGCSHTFAPCIKDHTFMEAVQSKGLIADNSELLTMEGCGSCPKDIGSCALLESIGNLEGNLEITEVQRNLIVAKLTTINPTA